MRRWKRNHLREELGWEPDLFAEQVDEVPVAVTELAREAAHVYPPGGFDLLRGPDNFGARARAGGQDVPRERAIDQIEPLCPRAQICQPLAQDAQGAWGDLTQTDRAAGQLR